MNLLLSGIFTGLAVASKWSGIFILPAVGFWEAGHLLFTPAHSHNLQSKLRNFLTKTGFDHHQLGNKFYLWLNQINWSRIKTWPMLIIVFVVLPASIYVFSYGQFWLQGHTIAQFEELHRQIWWYQTNLKATHPFQSRPWQWIFDLRPVWYFVEYDNNMVANMYDLANPVLAWSGLLAITWSVYTGLKREKSRLFIVLAYFCVWAFLIFSPRIMFFYHYLPAIPLLAIALSWMLTDWWQTKWKPAQIAAAVIVIAITGSFIYFFPHWTGMKVSQTQDTQYYWLKSWR
jgi:dolichyl-phosphate-mannose--protein O-mannosyl transferase